MEWGSEEVMSKIDDHGRRCAQVAKSIKVTASLLKDLKGDTGWLQEVAESVYVRMKSGGFVLCVGDLRSEHLANHMTAEMMVRFYHDRPAIPSLGGRDAVLYAAAAGFKKDIMFVFLNGRLSLYDARLIALAKTRGVYLVGVGGLPQKDMLEKCDTHYCVNSIHPPSIAEVQLCLIHIICFVVEQTVITERKAKTVRKEDEDR